MHAICFLTACKWSSQETHLKSWFIFNALCIFFTVFDLIFFCIIIVIQYEAQLQPSSPDHTLHSGVTIALLCLRWWAAPSFWASPWSLILLKALFCTEWSEIPTESQTAESQANTCYSRCHIFTQQRLLMSQKGYRQQHTLMHTNKSQMSLKKWELSEKRLQNLKEAWSLRFLSQFRYKAAGLENTFCFFSLLILFFLLKN